MASERGRFFQNFTKGLVVNCIFCKGASDNCRSIEHVIPESLGNSKFVLPKGAVCDSCNNYFAVKVEKPVLESQYFRQTRFRNTIPNKKGRIPKLSDVVGPNGESVEMLKTRNGIHVFYATDEKSEVSLLGHLSTNNKLMLIGPPTYVAEENLMSRFFCKVAFELLALSTSGVTPDWNEAILEKIELDEIRNYARYGVGSCWPVHRRRIYEESKRRTGENGDDYEILHEHDFLHTPQGEWYVIICIFGVEYAVNLGGPEVDGYKQWLGENGAVSPLYSGKNRGYHI